MLPERLPEQLFVLLRFLFGRLLRLSNMLFADPPEEPRRRFNMPMPSLWLSLLASAAFLVALIAMLYWLLITLAG